MIKQLPLFIALLFVTAQMKAQSSLYNPFPDSSATWNESVHWYNDTCDGNEYYTTIINGDTTINSVVYHELFETGYSYSAICGDSTTYFTNKYIGSIRQNVLLKEIYIFPKGDTSAALLYDFNLSLGDTLPATYLGAARHNYVSSVDSVLIGSSYRKIFGISLLDSSYVYASLIEGIGSTLGLVAPVTLPVEYSYLLNCFSQNGQTLYPDSLDSCGMVTGIKVLLPENSFSIYPDPTSNQLTIHSPSLQERTIVSIINVIGQEVN
jgi:hypothetical protein